MSCFLGIDIGTSSVKLIAMDETGAVLRTCGRDYQYSEPHPGWKEIWPGLWVDAIEKGLDELLENLDRTQVKAIGFTGQMHTTVFLDGEGNCIRPAIMWNDMRTKDRISSMKEELQGHEDTTSILRILSTGSPAANLMWLKEQEPEHYSRLNKFLIGPDYLVYHFTGNYSTDYCEASTSSLYDINRKCWSETMRTMLELEETCYPPVFGSQEVAGYLTEQLQKRFGLPSDVKVIAGTGDNPAAAVATGSFQNHYPVLSIGTSGVLVLSRDGLRDDVKGKQILFSMDGVHINVMVQGVVQSAGGSFNWYARHILGTDNFDCLTESTDMDTLGANDLLFYPHLNGDKTVFADPSLRGAFIGLDTNQTREDLAVAVMEGVCFAIKQLILEMGLTRLELERLKVTGGGSHSRVWMQILADVLDLNIEQLDGSEGASYGAAIMARNESLPTAGEPGGQTVKLCGRFTPRPYHVDLYESKYRKYVKIYDALKLINQ